MTIKTRPAAQMPLKGQWTKNSFATAPPSNKVHPTSDETDTHDLRGNTTSVERIIEVPEIQVLERIVPVHRRIAKEKLVHVPKVHVVERVIPVPKIVYEEKIVEYRQVEYRDVIHEKVVQVPEYRTKIVEKRVPVPEFVDVPLLQPTQAPIETNIERCVPVLVDVHTTKEYQMPRIKAKYHDVPVPIYVPRYIEIPVAAQLCSRSNRDARNA